MIVLTYAYIRVSTKHQKIDRQYEEIRALGVDDKHIFIDKESGKDFERDNYRKLIRKLKKDDLLIIKSIDRLGRNYQMILEQWAYITKQKGVNIRVLDMPLLNVDHHDLISVFIRDIVLQVLSFVAENERTNIKSRQLEGIRLAKAKGTRFGRPKVAPNQAVLRQYLNHEITLAEAQRLSNVSRSTLCRFVRDERLKDA